MGFREAMLVRTRRRVIELNVSEYGRVINADLARGYMLITIPQTCQHGDFVRACCQPKALARSGKGWESQRHASVPPIRLRQTHIPVGHQ